MNSTDRPTAITFTDGDTIRITAQTAADDHTATITPGTYPITWDTNGTTGTANLEISTPERQVVSTAIAGHTLSTRTEPAETRTYPYTLKAWELPHWNSRAAAPALTY